jgi:hypothetical protein
MTTPLLYFPQTEQARMVPSNFGGFVEESPGFADLVNNASPDLASQGLGGLRGLRFLEDSQQLWGEERPQPGSDRVWSTTVTRDTRELA